MEIRPEIMEFAEEMERVMARHDKKKGDSYKRCNYGDLILQFHDKKDDFDALDNSKDCDDASKRKLVDIANYCMMLFFRLKQGV